MQPQRFFVFSFTTLVIAQVLCEIYLSRLVPPRRKNLKLKFWSRAILDVTISILVGIVGYTVISVITRSGWGKLAWGLAIVPGTCLIAAAIVFQGTNTVLDRSSGVGCFGLLKAALK